jgi:structural maintenance of chromosome 3 (chondroitin sulfate proteoglycan 6)
MQLEGKKNAIEIELNERLRRRRDELKTKLDELGELGDGDSSSADDLESRVRELKTLNTSIQTLTKKNQSKSQLCSSSFCSLSTKAMEEEIDELQAEMQKLRASLEKVQNQQTEDSRMISRQQKTTERYLAKRQMLSGRKDECNRNIRDLGVLPEEAFDKYTSEKLDRVRSSFFVVISLTKPM